MSAKYIDPKTDKAGQAMVENIKRSIKDDRDFYLVEELAQKLRVSNMTIYRYIRAGKIKAHKIGKEFRISNTEFNNFLESVKTNNE